MYFNNTEIIKQLDIYLQPIALVFLRSNKIDIVVENDLSFSRANCYLVF